MTTTSTWPTDYRPAPDLLRERVILVTGASRGIGRVAALAFAGHGATVILHGRDVERLEAVYDEIDAAGGPQPIILPLDLAKAGERDYDNLAQAIESQLGRLDGILHNASHYNPLTALRDEHLTQWLDLQQGESGRTVRAHAGLCASAARRRRRLGDPHRGDPRAAAGRILGRVRSVQGGTAGVEHHSGTGVGIAAEPAHQRRSAR